MAENKSQFLEEYGHAWMASEQQALFSVLALKRASTAAPVYDLAGRLYLSDSGWLMLSVPNAFVHGLFSAIDEEGLEKPFSSDGKLQAHISIMRPAEVERIGANTITERGKSFHYQLGEIKTVSPRSWDGVSKVWYVTVYSPELKRLRASYGLEPLPNGDWDFHITVALRRKGVLQNGAASKAVA